MQNNYAQDSCFLGEYECFFVINWAATYIKNIKTHTHKKISRKITSAYNNIRARGPHWGLKNIKKGRKNRKHTQNKNLLTLKYRQAKKQKNKKKLIKENSKIYKNIIDILHTRAIDEFSGQTRTEKNPQSFHPPLKQHYYYIYIKKTNTQSVTKFKFQ